MPAITIKQQDEISASIALDSQPAGILRMAVLRPGNSSFHDERRCQITSIKHDDTGLTMQWHHETEGITATIELQPHDDGYVGTMGASGRGVAVLRLIWELPAGEPAFSFMPAFMYGRNRGGDSPMSTYPRLCSPDQAHPARPWASHEWLVRADRSSHCLSAVINDQFTCALGGRDVCRYTNGDIAEKNGLGTSATNPQRICYSLGFVNMPYTYCCVSGRNHVRSPEGCVDLDKGDATAPLFLFLYPHARRHESAGRLLRQSYAIGHEDVRDPGQIEQAVTDIADALLDLGYCQEAKNFYVTIETEPGRQLHLSCFGTGWTGGPQVAGPLLVAGHQMKNERWLSCAREVMSDLADNGFCEQTGLFYDNYDLTKKQWNTHGWWYVGLEQPGHSGYANGHACHYLLTSYQYEKAAGHDQPTWLAAAQRVLDHVADVQGDDGRFGYTYDESNGAILDGDGFSACWFTPAFATLHHITGEKRYLDVARRAMDFYRQYVEAFECYGGPHDIHKSPDEEGILAWIKAAHILHETTGEDRFLQDLLIGLDYEFSWKFAYNLVNEFDPLKAMDWCSAGGSVTSVNNSHIHPMGSAVAGSILYAAEQTNDPYLHSRLIDTVRWTLTIYLRRDGYFDWGKKGLINERFVYSDCLLIERYPDGRPASTWFAGHSWATGSVLDGLAGPVLAKARSDPGAVLGDV